MDVKFVPSCLITWLHCHVGEVEEATDEFDVFHRLN